MSVSAHEQRDTPLARALKARIQADGPIELAQFVSACLWDEAFGFYATRKPIGAAGDFITSPEISQTFGELLGLWGAVVWQQMGAPSAVTLMEAGPGRGTLMADALRATKTVPGLQSALHVHLMEASPTLEMAQRKILAAQTVPISWSTMLPETSFPLIVLANEFLDCLPVEQAEKTGAGWRLRCVGLDQDQRFCWADNLRLRSFPHISAMFPEAPRGSIHEFVQVAEPLGLAQHAAAVAALYIDYGHDAPHLGETLQAVRAHRHEHVFTSPGEADVSAYVNFAAVAEDARRAGLAVDGPVTQAEFLGSLGIMERASRLIAANPARANEIETGVARLMAPNGMGTRFKVLGVRSPELPPLPGFPVAGSRGEAPGR